MSAAFAENIVNLTANEPVFEDQMASHIRTGVWVASVLFAVALGYFGIKQVNGMKPASVDDGKLPILVEEDYNSADDSDYSESEVSSDETDPEDADYNDTRDEEGLNQTC